ncbi:MAG TPA: hypothetical protein VIL71_06330 [Spirillospora sp.]|mgnify:CR=1 FL=1
MCGLFGMVRSPFAAEAAVASDVIITLGMLAEERGTDSAGLALVGGWPGLAGTGPDGRGPYKEGCRVLRGRGRFSAVWRPELLPELDRAPVVVGHTRWATQGSPADPENASPMTVPVPGRPGAAVVATHNGDIDLDDLRSKYALPPAAGTTDSEPLFQLLAGCANPAEVTAVLESVVGRAALAWVHRDRPTEVHLARAALSPLAVAVDTEQNIYWASNPRWFRDVQRHTRVEFVTVVLLDEGTYVKIGMEQRPGRRDRPDVLDTATFVPTARDSDLDDRVWMGFVPDDERIDRANLRHRVVRRAGGTGTGRGSGTGTGAVPIVA